MLAGVPEDGVGRTTRLILGVGLGRFTKLWQHKERWNYFIQINNYRGVLHVPINTPRANRSIAYFFLDQTISSPKDRGVWESILAQICSTCPYTIVFGWPVRNLFQLQFGLLRQIGIPCPQDRNSLGEYV